MSYRWRLVAGWSARDWLAVAVLAVTVAFLTGTVLVAVGASAQVLGLAAEYGTGGTVERVDDPAALTAAGDAPSADRAGDADSAGDAVVIPATTATVEGVSDRSLSTVTVVAVPEPVTVPTLAGEATIRPVETGAATGDRPPDDAVTLVGPEGNATVGVDRAGDAVLAPGWYRVNGSTLDRLGLQSAFVIDAGDADATAVPSRGAPLRSAFAFFAVGSRGLVDALAALSVGVGALAAITVYSVSRIAVRDRRRAIRVARATGAPPRHLVAAFALRGGVLALAGTALGYAVGVVLLNLVVNAAVFLGVPTSLDLGVSPAAARVLVPAYAGVALVGVAAGGLAGWRTARLPPGAIDDALADPGASGGAPVADRDADPATDDDAARGPRSGVAAAVRSGTARARRALEPSLLGWRPLVPTAGALAVFFAVSLTLAAGAGALAPLVAGDTITEPGAVHPVASGVPEGYADALRASGTDASAELLAFSVVDGEAVLTRGADYGAFASVSSVSLTAGREPERADEAVVGADLAARLDLDPGDEMTLGGSTEPAVTTVTVVGVFAGPGAVDDQLIVSLPTARHLTGKSGDAVQFVRTDGSGDAGGGGSPGTDGAAGDAVGVNGSGVVVTSIDTPGSAVAGRNVTVEATLVAVGGPATVEVPARLGDQRRSRTVSLEAFEQRRVPLTFVAPPAGEHALRVGDREATLVSRDPDALALRGLPATAPPNSTPAVTVVTVGGDPVANATIAVEFDGSEDGGGAGDGGDGDGDAGDGEASRTVTTGPDGTARLPLGDPGTATVTARADGRTASATVEVSADARRDLVASVAVSPERPSVLSTPTVTAELSNPWNATVEREVTVAAAGTSTDRSVALAPGERTRIDLALARQPPGGFDATVATDGTTLAERRVEVGGDDRLAAALATAGVDRDASAIGRAVATVFGNLRLLVASLSAVAAVTVVGGVATAMASAVHARRRSLGIRRAAGATPRQIRRLVVADAVRVGAVATLLGGVAGVAAVRALDAIGALTVYGVSVDPTPSPATLAVLAVASVGLVAAGGLLAAVGVTRATPASLLAASGRWGGDE
ncbi:ABC transporter permease [Halobaculum sp. CBA1158]|uniref:FtsX-like permease family protein n=1 Tax=Halobaculum sp. CBA1158 TaxID=2904243 RepID=UPI001F360572|nr:ABC transporter permease [Halobaculum sp. CBA1158]UIO99739.1 ABC transporter permease [Halobaculum sp. CBA1158]